LSFLVLTVFSQQTALISVDHLHKLIHPSELTIDFDGTLTYNNGNWIETRMLYEEFVWKAHDLLQKLDSLGEQLMSPSLPDDVASAKLMIESHAQLRHRVSGAPINGLEAEAQHLISFLCGTQRPRNSGNGT
jgi:hypothetical protein